MSLAFINPPQLNFCKTYIFLVTFSCLTDVANTVLTGIDEETGRLVVSVHAGSGNANKVSSANHNFPPHVTEAAKVGISAIAYNQGTMTCYSGE
jgi:hypothetical protein